jgi:perosamine synthetase
VELPDRQHAWHLYAVRIESADPVAARQRVFEQLRAQGIGVNVHYLPVYLHSYYQSLGYPAGLCPVSERAFEGLLSIPMWHGLRDDEQDRVMGALTAAVNANA